MLRWKYSRPLLALFLFILAIAPMFAGNPLGQPGLQQTMAVAFLWGGLALTYDLLFGFTGLLSFGHALYFATGVYVSCILINHNVVPWWLAALIAMAVSSLLAFLVGAASLKTSGITFAMVTLAFGEAGHVIVNRNFFNLTGGENGIALDATHVPQIWIGVVNTKYIYWTALAALIFTYLVIWWVTESSAGRVFAALRDNEQRVQVLGLNTQRFKLLSFVISAALAALLGFVMLIAAGSAAPRFADSGVTISLLLMVVIGGAVTRWGAVLGGVFYSFASTRMQDLTQQESFKKIPHWIGGPIAEPALLLGLIFILIVMFSPGGLSGAYYRLRLKALSHK
ncbi:MAG: branched-chain amino acid ABC transporter permease [Actinomycetes bacterium]